MKKRITIIITAILFLIGIAFLLSKKPKIEPLLITSTEPLSESVFVNEKAEVVLTTNRTIKTEEGSNINVIITPQTKTSIVYQENKIRISPETTFSLGTDYEVEIKYKEESVYILNFSTNPFGLEQIEDEGNKQTEADLDFNEAYKSFLTDYPWYTKLPIDTFEYRIVYDFEEKSFRIRLKLEQEKDVQKQAIKKGLDHLKSIGVEEPIDYYVLDTDGLSFEPL